MPSYYDAAVRNQLTWLNDPVAQSIAFRRPSFASLEICKSVLRMCSTVLRLLSPASDQFIAPILWHPDLGEANIRVSASGMAHITGLIDWQHASVLPYMLQATNPPAFEFDRSLFPILWAGAVLPRLPEDFKTYSPERKVTLKAHHRLAVRLKFYALRKLANERRTQANLHPHIVEMAMLPLHILRCWSDGIGPIVKCLLEIQSAWMPAVPGTPCPLDSLPEEEICTYRNIVDAFERYDDAANKIMTELGGGGDGLVDESVYEEAKKRLSQMEAEWDESQEGFPCPLREGGYSFFLS